MEPKDAKPSEGREKPAPVSEPPTVRAVTKRQAIPIPRELASLPDDANAFPSSLPPPAELKAFRESSPSLAKRRRWSLLFVGLGALVTLGTAGVLLAGVGPRPSAAAITLRVEAPSKPGAPAVSAPATAAPLPAAAPSVAVEPPPERATSEAVAASEVAQPEPLAAPGQAPADAGDALTLLPRAEQLLRTDRRASAAQQARGLLEQVAAAYPINPHAQVALAEACLRLRDGPCAQKAVARAIKLRPRREPYRELEQEIRAAFP